MPKMKTHRGAAKRFKVTGGGRVKYEPINHNHLNTHKSAKRKRRIRQTKTISKAFEQNLRNLLPYA
jgi:large subunit ribosomal protein L35